MTTSPTAPAPFTASRGHLEWLAGQVSAWQAEGLVSPAQGNEILGRYQESRGFSLARLLLGIGVSFLGVGVIWLVASNFEQFSPLLRIGLVAALWAALLLGGEVLASRDAPPLVVGAVRTLAAFALGALFFQAAQSLQVPAYEPKLVGLWAAGVLVHAYAVRARGPLLIGAVGLSVWSVWQFLWVAASFADVFLAFALSGLTAIAVAASHQGRFAPFSGTWRTVGATLALVGLFASCIPINDDGFHLSATWWTWTLLALAVGGALVAMVRSDGLARWEVLGAFAAVVLGCVMVAWESGDTHGGIGAGDWAHSITAVLLYVAFAVGVAVVGTLRDSRTLPALATAALVVFTTFQGFAVFAEIITGAWLFVVLGLVFLATGLGFDRARRRIAEELEGSGHEAATRPVEGEQA